MKATFVACLISLGLGIPAVAAANYTISLGAGGADGSGAFDWDGSAFSNFLVSWIGPAHTYPIDLTAAANAGATKTGGDLPTACGTPAPTGAQLSFLLMSQDPCLASGTFSWTGQEQGSAGKVRFNFKWNDGATLMIQEFLLNYPFGDVCPGGQDCPKGNESGVWGVGGGGTSVPEPATLALLGLGLAGLGVMWRRRAA